MNIEDIFNNPQADEDLRQARNKSGRKRVTEEEHRRYVQDALFETFTNWQSRLTYPRIPDDYRSLVQTPREPEPIGSGFAEFTVLKQRYESAEEAVRQIGVLFDEKDISNFCSHDPNGASQTNRGLFATALVQSIMVSDKPLTLYFTGPKLNFFGYRLRGNVHVNGDLGDNTAFMMESGELQVSGICDGVVGPYLWHKAAVKVSGTIRDIGAVGYWKNVTPGRNLRNYYDFSGLDDLALFLKQESYHLLDRTYPQIKSDQPIQWCYGYDEVLHPQLLQIACSYNITLYQRQVRALQKEREALNQGAKSAKYERDSTIISGTAAAGVVGILSITPLAPVVVLGGLGWTAWRALNQHQKLKDTREERDSRCSDIEGHILFYQDEIKRDRNYAQQALAAWPQ